MRNKRLSAAVMSRAVAQYHADGTAALRANTTNRYHPDRVTPWHRVVP
ncbi:hypothetical protein ACFVUY_16520 [Kitasatospora sp. NPDC058063]